MLEIRPGKGVGNRGIFWAIYRAVYTGRLYRGVISRGYMQGRQAGEHREREQGKQEKITARERSKREKQATREQAEAAGGRLSWDSVKRCYTMLHSHVIE